MDITTLFTSKKTILFPFQKMMGNLQITFCLITLFRITTRFSIGNSGDLAQNCNFPNYLFSIQLFINKKQMIMKKFYLLLGSMLMVSAWPVHAQQILNASDQEPTDAWPVTSQQSLNASDQEPTDAWPTDAWPVTSQQSINASDQEPADAWPTDAWPVASQQSLNASDQEPADAWPTDAWPVASQQSLSASDQEPADAWP